MEITDLLGFPLRDFLFPGQKKLIELKNFSSTRGAAGGRRRKETFL